MIKVLQIKAPPDILNSRKLKAAVQDALEAAAPQAKALLEGKASAWKKKNKPSFRTRKEPMVVTVYTTKAVYVYQDWGTDPHVITPKKKKLLRFRPKGAARRGKGSRSNYVFARRVNHPGTPARNFSITTAQDMTSRVVHLVKLKIETVLP